ncbi:hypothetical protein [uncultured Pontibacter sp.]|uniref:hypothetical protein n=1 Tax=uncultured Pontibacter sp. TaxID=453356 RepID=UPI002618056F|nr:hypothetical protein [uncultured Pontibacter sp.]
MKKCILLLLLLLAALQTTFAQDRIVKLNGDELMARVLEIKLQEIVYQHPDSLHGALHTLPKADVFMIHFANGTKEVFTQNLPESQTSSSNYLNPDQMYQLGSDDARRLYKGTGAMWGSAGCALFFPYGLAGSAAIGLTKPKAYRNPVSNINYLTDPHYVKGYEQQAHRKKAGKVAAGAGIGLAAITAVVVVVLASVYQ